MKQQNRSHRQKWKIFWIVLLCLLILFLLMGVYQFSFST